MRTTLRRLSVLALGGTLFATAPAIADSPAPSAPAGSARTAPQASAPDPFTTFDTNGDDRLDRNEYLRAAGGQSQTESDVLADFDTADDDADGCLNPDEYNTSALATDYGYADAGAQM